jgi:hypothetical protein
MARDDGGRRSPPCGVVGFGQSERVPPSADWCWS